MQNEIMGIGDKPFMDDPWMLVGLAAGALTTAGYLPQIVKGYRTKRLEDVSYLLLVMLLVGMSLWLAYGLLNWSLPIIVANLVAVILVFALILMKRRYAAIAKQ